jgi:cytochrome b6-f complex iron-sulfur subunit
MNRRDLIQKFVLGGTVLVLAPSVLQSCSKDSTTDPGGGNTPPSGTKIIIDLTLPENAVLNSTGGSKVVQTILVANTGTGYIALSSICTHQGCIVGYDTPSGNIKCPCHGSQFTSTGSIVNGPAATPLQAFPVSKTGSTLTISV